VPPASVRASTDVAAASPRSRPLQFVSRRSVDDAEVSSSSSSLMACGAPDDITHSHAAGGAGTGAGGIAPHPPSVRAPVDRAYAPHRLKEASLSSAPVVHKAADSMPQQAPPPRGSVNEGRGPPGGAPPRHRYHDHDRDVSDRDDARSAKPRPPSPTQQQGIAPPRRSARSLDAFTHPPQVAWQPQQDRDLSHIGQISAHDDFDLFSARHGLGRQHDKRRHGGAPGGAVSTRVDVDVDVDTRGYKENVRDGHDGHAGSRKEQRDGGVHDERSEIGTGEGDSDDEACSGERVPLQQGRNSNSNNQYSVDGMRGKHIYRGDAAQPCAVRASTPSIVQVRAASRAAPACGIGVWCVVCGVLCVVCVPLINWPSRVQHVTARHVCHHSSLITLITHHSSLITHHS
jgi:hypothetical protein